MNISIDIGNTKSKLAIFENDNILEKYSNISAVDIIAISEKFINEKLIISSVNEQSTHLYNLIPNKKRVLLMNSEIKIPIINNYNQKQSLGMDRLSAAIGVYKLNPDSNNLIIDMGTCITYDIITKENQFEGGIISAGIGLRAKALHNFTSKLPFVEVEGNFNLIGKSTAECIESGILNGILGEIQYIIDCYLDKYEGLSIFLTGGDSHLFETKIKQTIFVNSDIVLIGLNCILNYNETNF